MEQSNPPANVGSMEGLAGWWTERTETMGTCDTCAKRGEWKQEQPQGRRAQPYVLAKCSHRPLPPFWRNAGEIWVMPGCGSECVHYVPRETPNVAVSGG